MKLEFVKREEYLAVLLQPVKKVFVNVETHIGHRKWQLICAFVWNVNPTEETTGTNVDHCERYLDLSPRGGD